MRVTVFHCGPIANDSEQKCFAHLKSRLQSEPGDAHWVLLTNLTFSVNNQLQSDEIDIIAIGPPGVRVIEIKHWTAQWFEGHMDDVNHQADRLTMKARKVGSSLRSAMRNLPVVDGALILTQEPSKVARVAGRQVRGVGVHTLNDWKAAIGFASQPELSTQQVELLAHILQPRVAVAVDGSLRRLAGYVNLELQTPREQRFHRVYKGSHPARRDRVMLHLYDLSADEDRRAEARAKREFESLHRLQLYPWAPRILDSYQEAPGYEGEMYFFTVVDPVAPCIEDRTADMTWTSASRVEFARNAVHALNELHHADVSDGPIIHRKLTPQTILVKHDNSPILTGFERTRIPSESSVASSSLPAGEYLGALAPEVQRQGLSVADQRSDIYSLCACLTLLFRDDQDEVSQHAVHVLSLGLATEPDQRCGLERLETALSELLGESLPPPSPPPARFWTEDQIIRFRDCDYRIISRLGSGGVGTTFKVIEIDRSTKEDLGTYVAKVAHEGETGRRILRAYSLVRSHLRHTALSIIFEVAREWHENEFVALMTWISGAPLSDFAGVFPLLAEEQQESSSEALALRWLSAICEALDVLHRNGLVHGDVSPRNLIVSGSDLVLTDYDFVAKIGDRRVAPGTISYCSPLDQDRQLVTPSDDIYALAASFFHIVFEKEPFRYGGELDKTRGLNWEGVSNEEYARLAAFLNRATHPDPQSRFANVADALAVLMIQKPAEISTGGNESELEQPPKETVAQETLSEQRVEWLGDLLQSYPGSHWGNRETRGLDTEFADRTYVQTALEEALVRAIRERQVRLVILCGNAGDGKTALLQRLATQLRLGKYPSSNRIIEGRVQDGPLVRMNLDGSASWKGRSADEILDEFLEPFREGLPTQDVVHILAINDGRLLEWIERVEQNQGGTESALTEELRMMLAQETVNQDSYIRFISLNQRSLVGGITSNLQGIDTTFLERLMDNLYGGDRASEIWAPCLSCSAQDRCEVLRASHLFGPNTLPGLVEPDIRKRARQQLFEALQAVHLGGETHITMRELRAALVYILFGIHVCDDYHDEATSDTLPYWDRAFAPNSPARQGEVLRELARIDPALEAHPQIDRYLLTIPVTDSGKTAPHYPMLTLESARRRAFFEWTPNDIAQIAADPDALDLARGRHLRLFRNLPLTDKSELDKVCERLCRGISRLEDLPPQALERSNVVPLRVTPRTPTETAFWVEKPLDAFHLKADLPPVAEGVERLHRQAILVYQYRDGNQERLRLGAELFHLLLELADGYQLGDVSTDDTFAHLSVFVQRLVREDERELLAWNPMQEEAIFRVSAAIRGTKDSPQQRITITQVPSGGQI